MSSQRSPSASPSRESDLQQLWREALLLWLRYNDCYERVTAAMFQSRHSPQKLEAMLDELDHLRWRAAELSQSLLDP